VQLGAALAVVVYGESDGPITALLSIDPPDGRLAGMAVFRQSVAGRADYEAVVPISRLNETTLTIPFDNRGRAPVGGTDSRFATGIALAVTIDPATSPATLGTMRFPVLIEIRDTLGNLLDRDALPIWANGHTAFELGDTYPRSIGHQGTVTLILVTGSLGSTKIGLSGLGIQFNPDGAFTSSHSLSILP
jgi:hypothetical protein